jgi:hypothetical protein
MSVSAPFVHSTLDFLEICCRLPVELQVLILEQLTNVELLRLAKRSREILNITKANRKLRARLVLGELSLEVSSVAAASEKRDLRLYKSAAGLNASWQAGLSHRETIHFIQHPRRPRPTFSQ